MRAVLIGGGAVGFQIAQSLIADGSDVVLIEKDQERASLLSQRLDCLIITHEGNDLAVLEEAGTERADVFIAVTSSDEVNMIMCGIVAREFQVPVKIARVRNAAYASVFTDKAKFMGIDFIVNPEVEAARELLTSVRYGASSDIILFEKSRHQIRNIRVSSSAPIVGSLLRDAVKTLDLPFLVVAIEREGTYLVPSGQTELRRNDVLYVAGTEDTLEKLFVKLGKPKTEFRKILIVGGGRIGTIVAENLLGLGDSPGTIFEGVLGRKQLTRNAEVKIVDLDAAKCRELAARFPAATVLNADISDEDLFQEERLGDSDLVIAVTGNQEMNLVAALYAKYHGVRRSAVVISNTSYTEVSRRMGLDVIVSIKQSVANSVLAIVRGGAVKTIHGISDGTLEVLEFQVEPSSIIAGKKLKDVPLPPNSLVIWLSRGDETMIPDGNTEILGGDTVAVIANHSHFDRLKAFFTVNV